MGNKISFKKSEDIQDMLNYLNSNPEKTHEELQILEHQSISKLHYHDILATANSIPRQRKEAYLDFLSESEMYQNILNAYILENKELAFFTDHKNHADTREKEDTLKNFLAMHNWRTTENNCYLLKQNPVLLEYFLSEEDLGVEEKIRLLTLNPNVNSLSYMPEPASDELLDKIASSFKNLYGNNIDLSESGSNDFINKHLNPYIALSGLKNKYLPIDIFENDFFKREDTVHLKNIETIYNAIPENHSIERLTMLFSSLIAENDFYNKWDIQQLKHLVKLSKAFNFSSLPFSIEDVNIPLSNCIELGLFSDEQLIYLDRDIGNLTIEDIDINQLLEDLHWNPKPESLKDAIRQMKNKKLTELTIQESNIILALTKELLYQNDASDFQVSFSYENIKDGSWACVDFRKKTLRYGMYPVTIRKIITLLFHEINHAIQEEHCRTMNIDADPDLIDYSKDEILRIFCKGINYYDTNYNNFSIEFDADFKAHLQAKHFFGELEGSFDEILDNYLKTSNYYHSHSRFYQSEDNVFENIDECFNYAFPSMCDKSSHCRKKMIKIIKQYYPILEYEYDFNTGKPRTIKELVNMKNSYDENLPEDAKIIKILNHIIKYRCTPSKVGEKVSQENSDVLAQIQQEEQLKAEIMNHKSEFEKYSLYFQSLKAKPYIDTTDSIFSK